MTDRLPELLCPAGSREAALAALANGADALYLGAASFGARVSAGFDEKALGEIIDLCHFLGRRVYVTVNTLVKEAELDGVRQTLRMLERLRADAVLVQDMGVLRLIQTEFPALCVHASTQMSLHNAAGARLMRQLGVRRVVLARECTLSDIRAVAATGVETEVFVHGAQCVCVSGQCRFSGLIGGRSGNRGRCAQPCRLPYQWQGQTAAWLSPRDICLRDHLQALKDAGVCSLKIEGRLKRPEYVAVVTRVYRDALDALANGRFSPAKKEELQTLSQVFSRTFFPGYAGGAQDAGVIQPARVSSAGIDLGTVCRVWKKGALPLCSFTPSRTLHNGDGLQLRGAREQNIIYSGEDVPAGQPATLRLHFAAKPGDVVTRIDDEHQLAAARQSYEGKNALPHLPFDAVLRAVPDRNALLSVRDSRVSVQVQGDPVQFAQNAPLDEERVRRALEKTGDTLYTLRALRLEGENAYLPPAALNDLRRRALEALRQARIAAWQTPAPGKPDALPMPPACRPDAPRLYAQVTDPALAAPLLDAGADAILYAPADLTEPALSSALRRLPAGAYVALPVQLADETLTRIRETATALELRLCAGSVGQLLPGQDMLLSEGVPVWNHLAARQLRAMGAAGMVLPRELSGDEIAALRAAAADVPLILPVYGRARLMYLNHCPARTARGLTAGREKCRLCEQGKGCLGQALTDRRGEQFPLLPVRMERGCLVQLLSCRARSLNGRADRTLSWLLDFTLEDAAQAASITRAYRALLDGNSAAPVPGSPERYDVGVE